MNAPQVEEIEQYFGAIAECLRSDLRQTAESHSDIRRELQEVRDEFRDEFKEMRVLMFEHKTLLYFFQFLPPAPIPAQPPVPEFPQKAR